MCVRTMALPPISSSFHIDVSGIMLFLLLMLVEWSLKFQNMLDLAMFVEYKWRK